MPMAHFDEMATIRRSIDRTSRESGNDTNGQTIKRKMV